MIEAANNGSERENEGEFVNKTALFEIPTYVDPWMDNGLENFFRMLKALESCEVELTKDSIKVEIKSAEGFIKAITEKILEKRRNLLVTEKNKKTGETKEVKKDHLILQEEKKIGGKVAFKEDLYKPEKTTDIVSNVFNLRVGKNRCILCGREFDKAVKKLQQANYPFVTKIASMSGVRSYKGGEMLSLKEYYDNLCPLCYLIGILAWTDKVTVYRTFPGEKSFLFLPIFEDLKKLHEFKSNCAYSGILKKTARYSNIKANPDSEDVENTPGEFSTLLCFYEKFVETALDDVAASDWAILQIPFGAVKNIKTDFVKISDGILGTIKELKDEGSLKRIYSDSVKKMYFFSENKKSVDWDMTREIQEKLSKTFLFDDFRVFSRCLLPRKGGYVSFSSEVRQNLEELISVWRCRKMGVSKEWLDSIKSVGNIIAKISRNNASLLYKMDKVRTVEEFWSVLREVARKIPGMEEKQLRKIRPTALDELIQLVKEVVKEDKEGWREVRDLLVVYSSMYYGIDKMYKGGENK
jgi:hypothetical protein